MAEVVILSIVLIIICLVALKVYMHKKSTFVKKLGYLYVYNYSKMCCNLEYYRNHNKNKCNDEIYKSNYNEMMAKKDKWYLSQSSKAVILNLMEFYRYANLFIEDIAPYYSLTHYFAYSERERFDRLANEIETKWVSLADKEYWRYLKRETGEKILYEDFQKQKCEHNLEELRQKHNKEFVEKELRECRSFFDSVLKYPLDPQQRESIVKLEDNCLVISSAGSGKTSTSIAKVKYLLEKQKLKKEEIVVVSYNKKTAEEFQKRLDIPGLTCKTFHALALSIIGEVEGERPDVCEDTLLLTCYYNLVRSNQDFKAAINKFVSEVSSLTKGEHEYTNSEDYYKDRETYGIMSPYGDMNGSPIYTRSEEEKKICIWLSSHDVKFLYEQPYPINTADTQHRQYRPDFTIYFERDGRRGFIFLEHFGIDRNGNVPHWFGEGCGGFIQANREYNDGIRWKRDLHHINNTALLETTSAMFHDGTVYQRLEEQLRDYGVPMRLLTEDEKYERMIQRNHAVEKSIMDLFSSFINLMKSNGKTFDTVMNTIRECNLGEAFNERCRFLMYEVIAPLYAEYCRILKERKQMDYIDLVLHATDLCNSGKYKTPYSYILVDEFQDISLDRYKFILSLRKKGGLTKTFCVGDDWQSIYRFSGSDMNLFNHFEDYFGFTERCMIETTYRFGNPLIKRSSEFILKNPNQVKKTVRPFSDDVTTELSFVPFTRGEDNKDYLEEIRKVICGIPANESIMLMARYNHDVNVFPSDSVTHIPNSNRKTVTFAGRTINFMSVHAAKGLEADNIILLNCSQDSGGFPSRITDDPILGFVLSEIDTFEYSEERRLFYVAITRAKKHAYVLYNSNMPSVFVAEMLDSEDINHFRCPRCKRGLLRNVRDGVSINRNQYRNFLCSNSVAGCHFFWQVYYDTEEDIPRKYHREMGRYFIHAAPSVSAPSVTGVNQRVSALPRLPEVPSNWEPSSDESSADDLPF